MSKVIMITGASSGIGRETAKLFQSKNWKVAATMRKPEENQDLERIADIECFKLDVTDPDSIKRAIADAIAKFGRIDAIVNNAGYGLNGPFEETSDEQIKRQFETNVFGLMNVCREIIPHFRENKKGVIVNVASVGGRSAFPFYSLYNSTKWAVEGFSESLQYELRPFHIRLKIIEPGPIKTDFYSRSQDVAKSEDFGIYTENYNKLAAAMARHGENAPGGSVVAEKIYDAVTDNSSKLRYPVNTKGLLALKRVLPERLYFYLVRNVGFK